METECGPITYVIWCSCKVAASLNAVTTALTHCPISVLADSSSVSLVSAVAGVNKSTSQSAGGRQ